MYGTTAEGGAYGGGTVFKIAPTPPYTLTTLHSFCGSPNCTDGYQPVAGLVQATNGDFYGTTYTGGANNDGTIFKITPGGALTRIYSFCAQPNCTDGIWPVAGLIQATDGNLYGTTWGGGNYAPGSSNCGDGTVFKITPAPPYTLTTLYSFCSQPNCTDGANPYAALVQDTNGTLYGATWQYRGTIFSISVGLGPFVKTVPSSGKVGQKVTILGTNLAGATGVTFNGTPATGFTVNTSGSAIAATVPPGATTGTVAVVTSRGSTLSSNIPFRVQP